MEKQSELQSQPCTICGRALRGPGGITVTGDPGVVIFMSGVTRGRRPRLKTRALPVVFCNPCASSIALGAAPVERGDLYVKGWGILRNIIQMDDQNAVILSAVTQLRYPRARLQPLPGSKELPAAS